MSKKCKHPNIELRDSGNGSVSYRVKVRIKGSAPATNTFKRLEDAKRWRDKTASEIRENKHFPAAKAKKHTVAELIDQYLADVALKNARRYNEVKPLLEWWKAGLKDRVLSGFSGEDVLKGQQALLSRVKQRKDANGQYRTLSPATVNRYMVALHTAIQFGIKPLKWIAYNPVCEVDKLKEPSGRTRFLTEDEINKLLAACKDSKNPYLFAIVVIGLATGARREEIRNMQWKHVNADLRFIELPKTKNGEIRSAILTGVASDLIGKMRENKGNSAYLFPSPNDPCKPIDFESAWRSALKISQIQDFRFHDNRHTCASYLAMNGASLLVIAETLGQKTAAMAKRYSHLTKGYTSQVVSEMTAKVLGHVEI